MASYRGCLIAALLALALLPGVAAAAQGPDTDAVASAYAAARTSGDPDALLALFADDAVVTDRLGQRHAGTAEIRRLLQLAISRSQALAITERRTSGDHVSWVEQAATPDLNFAYAVEAVVQDGRIRSLVYRDDASGVVGPVSLATGTLLPPALGLGLLLLVLTVAAIVVWVSQPAATTRSRDRTVLLVGLRQWRQTRQPPEARS